MADEQVLPDPNGVEASTESLEDMEGTETPKPTA